MSYKDDTFLARWLSGELTDDELKAFEASSDYKEIKKIIDTLEDAKEPIWQTKESSWNKFKEEVSEESSNNKTIRLKRRWLLAAAAIGILLIGALIGLFNIQNRSVEEIARMAEKKSVKLIDGTMVLLNADTKLSYKPSEFEEMRTVQLEGEALFTVVKGTNFIVQTSLGDVKVLGTKFNVYSRAQTLEVSCYEGSVGVKTTPNSNLEVLKLNEKFTFRNKLGQRSTFQGEEASPSWSQGQSQFVNTPILEVLLEIERQYDVQIDYPNSISKLEDFNGGFPHNNLETALKIICSSINYQFEINGGKVKVFK
ncbi:MAG: FecR domain-containing protein [Bacteroidota bacterium]